MGYDRKYASFPIILSINTEEERAENEEKGTKRKKEEKEKKTGEKKKKKQRNREKEEMRKKKEKKRRRRCRDWCLYMEKEEALQRPPPSFLATAYATASHHKRH
jgi:hypothetical protein